MNVLAFVMETAGMALLLLIAQPFDNALQPVNIMAAPMILADIFAIAVFAFLLRDVKAALQQGQQYIKV